ncbi:hypothetical protein [Nocardia terpenica]|uniref:Uncharacterized protein n=1 Tax=Nocardia terpenica TaxID=455432 RepID=A0A6G9Z263_9NOCA|nr:hypothetical protein [Nocardia terpenica]QIS19544.1 hypothetical protein F6W96_15890 [Nocardia terpenica]
MADVEQIADSRTVVHRDGQAAAASDRTAVVDRTGLLAASAAVAGLVMLIAVFARLNQIPAWADDHGAVLVYLAFFFYMSVAGRLTWWGIDTLIGRMKSTRSRG